jgi:hypothetical protein
VKPGEKKVKIMHRGGIRRHSRVCPCAEHIRTQSHYYSTLLQKLGKSSLKGQKKIVSSCDACFIRFLGKCACGVLHTDIKLKKKDYSSLKPSKNLLVALAQPNTSITRKRELLKKQTGAAIPFFSILGTIASSVLSNLLS